MFEKRVALLSKIDWAEAEAVFYELMRTGWASGEKALIGRYPGHKQVQQTKGPYKVIDLWTKTPGSVYSSGYTVLLYDCMHADAGHIENDYQPIWTMQYGGLYSKPAAEFVKAVLAESYGNPAKYGFCGCRGPHCLSSGGFEYRNRAAPHSSFLQFSGMEIVMNTHQDEQVGHHEYMGRAHLTPATGFK